jgi:lipid A 4'-phosphatase
VVWLAYALIYRWPSTRLSDQGVEAALTRLGWPGYRWRQRLRGKETGPSPTA